MSLTGSQHKQVQDALLSAFGEASLRHMVKFELDQDLDQITGGRDLTERAFHLVKWADEHGCVADLINGALRQNPTSPDLIDLAAASATWPIKPPAPAEQAPYKGLEFYGVADAALFFGRKELTDELHTYLKDHRFLAVVGASGSGKSSVVRAGVVAALQKGEKIKGSERWAVHIVTPTARPLTALAAELTKESESVTAQATLMDDLAKDPRSLDLFAGRLLARSGAPRLLLVVDQFEEMFTLCKERKEQQDYVDNLLAAATPEGCTTVILTLRADFYARCAEFNNLRKALQDWQKYIGPMTRDDLSATIKQPALRNGWDFEPELVDAILEDVQGEAGALPLLSHALLETWKRRSGRTLTFTGYHAAGGVRRAIAHTADAVYAGLPTEQQAIARSIFLRLTTLGEGAQDTRRRASLAELLGSGPQPAQVQAVLTRLADDRLVTAERAAAAAGGAGEPAERAAAAAGGAGEPAAVYVDVTHEALIREWPRLAAWLNEDRESLLLHRRLTEAAAEWDDLGRDPSLLFRGVRLAQIAEWAVAHVSDLNDLEHKFFIASQKQVDAERFERERIRRQREDDLTQRAREQEVAAKRLQQHNRMLLAALGVATVAFIVVGFLAWQVNLAQERLARLKVEELLTSARNKRMDLDAEGAVADYNAAAAAAAEHGQTLDVSSDISDTLRFVATTYVLEGEEILCRVFNDHPEQCERAATTETVTLVTATIAIEPVYLEWAQEVAPQIVNWASYTSPVQQQAVISATALFRYALALSPPADAPSYVWIAPGTFKMGSTDEQCERAGIGDCPPDEQPHHPVELGGYWIQRTEVTNEQYARCVAAGPCEPPETWDWDEPGFALLPVTGVDRTQADAYAAWVGGRLPTEAEWENGCRSADSRLYPWGDELPTEEVLSLYPWSDELPTEEVLSLYPWVDELPTEVVLSPFEQGDPLTEVGTYLPGTNGLYDMAGNVWEWTADWYDRDYYASSPERNPAGPAVGIHRTLRGGPWTFNCLRVVPSTWDICQQGVHDSLSDALCQPRLRTVICQQEVRCAERVGGNPSYRGSNVGFRVVSPAFYISDFGEF